MAYKVIDLSKFNNVTNFVNVAKNVDGIILRAGYRSYGSGQLTVDPKFNEYMNNFYNLGVKMGIYYFTTAINAAEGRQEAEFAVNLIKRYKLSFPIFVDTEIADTKNKNGRSDKLSKQVRTSAIIAFCERIKELGYTPGIYASDSWFVSQLEYEKIKKYKLWVASYSYTPKRVTSYIGWQYSSNGSIPGINGRVDMNNWYENLSISTKPTENTNTNPNVNKYPTLKYGDKGDSVKWLQNALNKLGYKLDPDGEFGPKTRDAVKAFQKAHKLTVDGIAGQQTIGLLVNLIAEKTNFEVNAPVKLIDTPLYSNSTTSTPARKVTDTWYIAIANTVNNRVRVKKTKDTSVIAGWINWSEVKNQFN